MIGVIADPSEQAIVREFFELFKTPWEFYRKDGQYEVLLVAGDLQLAPFAKLVLCYAGRKMQFDEEQKTQSSSPGNCARFFLYQGNRIPIYGDTITFLEKRSGLLTDEDSQECAAYQDQQSQQTIRIGYDLFGEIRTLLTVGQPPANADIPALDLHIAFLRDLITGCGVSLVEIPPVPDGYPFIACLTHDVDHPSIRQHKWDHTIFGFLHRAIFGSLRKLIRGQMTIREVIRNWVTVLKLPFVHVGLAKDFWREFDDRYLELERGLPSTFFVIPAKDYPGKSPEGPAPAFRAAGYGAQDIAGAIKKLMAAGCEVGLHGIDAWLDSSKGREELDEIRRLTRVPETGVRMHWLYQNDQSPAVLEKAGAAYDSTIGYNETVGYRAGTTQVFKPLGTRQLLELPLHVMDTALFYRDYLDLSPRQARTLLSRMVVNAIHFGGCLTINWHDRSLAPERLWGGSYRELVQDMKSKGAWFSTAGQAVSWFQKRRSATFETDSTQPGRVRAKVALDQCHHLPGLRLRIHKPRDLDGSSSHGSGNYADLPVDGNVDIGVPSEVAR